MRATENITSHSFLDRRYMAAVDSFDGGIFSGWVIDDLSPTTPVQLLVEVDGQLVVKAVADEMRPDLLSLGHSGRHGFCIALHGACCDGRMHEVALRVPGEEQTLTGQIFDVLLPVRPKGWRQIRGHIDKVNGLIIHGWACAWGTEVAAVEVEAQDEDGVVLATAVASRTRDDLRIAGLGDGAHGFSLALPLSLLLGEPGRTIRVVERESGQIVGTPVCVTADLATLLTAQPEAEINPRRTNLLDGFQSVIELAAYASGLAEGSSPIDADPFLGQRVTVLADDGALLNMLPQVFRGARSVDVLIMNSSPETDRLERTWPAWHRANLRMHSIHSLIPKYCPADNICGQAAATITRRISASICELAKRQSVYDDVIVDFSELLFEGLEPYIYAEVFRKLTAVESIIESADRICFVTSRPLTWASVFDLVLQHFPAHFVFLHTTEAPALGAVVSRVVQALRRRYLPESALSPPSNTERDLVTHLDLAIETAGKLMKVEMAGLDGEILDRREEVEVFIQLGGSYAHAFIDGLGDLLRHVLDGRDVRLSYIDRQKDSSARTLNFIRANVGMTKHMLHVEPCPDTSLKLQGSVTRLQQALADFLVSRRLVCFKNLDCTQNVADHVRGALGQRLSDVLQAVHHFAIRFGRRRPHRLLAYPGAETIARVALRSARAVGIPTADCQMIFVAEDPRNVFHWRREADTLFVMDGGFAQMFHRGMQWPQDAMEVTGSIRIDSMLKANQGVDKAKARTLLPGIEPDHKMILLAMQPYAEQEMMLILDAMCRVASAHLDVTLVIRPHPIDGTTVRKRYLRRGQRTVGAMRVLDGHSLDLGKSILAADLVVSVSSNVLLEAACLGADCVVAEVSSFPLPPSLDFGGGGIGVCARSEEELARLAEAMLFDVGARAKARERREAYFRDNPQYQDLGCASRIANRLVQ